MQSPAATCISCLEHARNWSAQHPHTHTRAHTLLFPATYHSLLACRGIAAAAASAASAASRAATASCSSHRRTWVQQAQHGCNSMGAHHMDATAWVHSMGATSALCNWHSMGAPDPAALQPLRCSLSWHVSRHADGFRHMDRFRTHGWIPDAWTDSRHMDRFRTHGQIPDTWIDSRHMD